MYRVGEILELLEREAPLSSKEPWDNVGLLVGSLQQKVSRIGIALNVLPSTVNAAIFQKCSLLITHHPPFFSLEHVRTETPEGGALKSALCNDLAILSLHTNLDRSLQGINGTLGKLLALRETIPLVPAENSNSFGDGIVGFLEEPLSLQALGAKIRLSWKLSWVIGYLSPERNREWVFSKIALLGGSGSSFWQHASRQGAELFITGDLKYHHRIEALQQGLSLVEVDHGEMEEVAFFEIARKWEHSFEKALPFSYIPFQSWEKPAMLLQK